MEYSDDRHLALVERRIVELKAHIERQRRVIADLECARRGNSEIAEIARELLQTLERNLHLQIRDKRWVSGQMRQ